MGRTIIHYDMDMFYAAVEIRDNPELAGKPLIIGALPNERGVVSTCSYEARKFGVHSAMSIKEAYRLCPHGIYMHPNGQKYMEQNLQFGIIERFEESAFSGIYPRRTGTVGAVRTEQRTGDNGDPFTVYFFADPGLTFDPNDYELPGLVKNIVFQSGELNGRDFEVNFNSVTKEFEIITQFPDGFDQLPGGLLIPGTGDEYILYNITMPNEYYGLAEQEFKEAVKDFMEKYNLDKAIYKGDTDYIEVSKRNVSLVVGQRVKLESNQYFPEDGYRISRITSVTRKLNNPAIATVSFSDVIAVGKIEELENSISEAMNYARASASLPDIIKTWENTRPTDYNLFSALRSMREFLSKNNDDTARGLITFLKGIEVGDFETGFLGSGAAITVDEEGITTAEVDKLIVRRYAKFFELIIERLSHIGGQLIISPARIECSRVEELPGAYRCYFETGENGEFVQEFVIGDQARCQVFTGSTMKYYWRLVTGIGSDYIDLSKTDADGGSAIPAAGDHIVQLGNRTNPERQNAQILSSFGEDAPSYKQYSGINSYSLVGKYVTGFTSKGNKITGQVTIEAGSSGWQNLDGLPEEIEKAADVEVGGVNLLRNTGFTGDFQTRQLEPDTQLTPTTEMFSERLKYWEGNAQVNADAASASGYSCRVFTRLSQPFFKPVIEGERYVISFKAKGNVTVKIGTFKALKSITEDFERIVYRFEAIQATGIEFTGDCTICEIQLERGTIATTWSVSPYDNPEATAQFEAIRYLSDAIRGKTSILGGLILTSMIQLGIFRNGELEKITSGISGIYNDDDDVAFWAGGRLEDAIRTSMRPKEKGGANAVITHGGRAIFNEAIIRGLIYAEGGIFKGRVEAEEGVFRGRVEATEGFFRGKLETSASGRRVVIDNENANIIIYNQLGSEVFKITFDNDIANGEFAKINMTATTGNGTAFGAILSPLQFSLFNVMSDGTNDLVFAAYQSGDIRVSKNLTQARPPAGKFQGMLWRDGETLKVGV